jgi:hypothetical protein
VSTRGAAVFGIPVLVPIGVFGAQADSHRPCTATSDATDRLLSCPPLDVSLAILSHAIRVRRANMLPSQPRPLDTNR